MLGIAESVRQCKDRVLLLMLWAILSNFQLILNQIYSQLRCSRTISQGCLFIIRTSIYKTSSAPGACCGHVMASWQKRRMVVEHNFQKSLLGTFYKGHFMASSWTFPSMAGVRHWPVADQPQRKTLPLRWLPGNYLALYWLTYCEFEASFSYTSILNH